MKKILLITAVLFICSLAHATGGGDNHIRNDDKNREQKKETGGNKSEKGASEKTGRDPDKCEHPAVVTGANQLCRVMKEQDAQDKKITLPTAIPLPAKVDVQQAPSGLKTNTLTPPVLNPFA